MLFLIYADYIIYENNVENWIRETQEEIEDWKVMSIYLKEDVETQDRYGYYLASNLLRIYLLSATLFHSDKYSGEDRPARICAAFSHFLKAVTRYFYFIIKIIKHIHRASITKSFILHGWKRCEKIHIVRVAQLKYVKYIKHIY